MTEIMTVIYSDKDSILYSISMSNVMTKIMTHNVMIIAFQSQAIV